MDYARGGFVLISLSTSEFGGFVEHNGRFSAMGVLRVKDDLITLSEVEIPVLEGSRFLLPMHAETPTPH